MALLKRTEATFYNNSPRNIWWFRAMLRELNNSSRKQLAFNMNANSWRWLYDFLSAEWNHRRRFVYTVFSLIPSKENKKLDGDLRLAMEMSLRRNFEEWVKLIGQYYFKTDLILIPYTNRIYPKKFTIGIRDINDRIYYITTSSFESMKASGEIKWCSYKKDWYNAAAFIYISSFKKEANTGALVKTSLYIALPKIFTCPICQNNYLHDPINIRNSKVLLATKVCPLCETKELTNKPHTENTIWGDYHSHTRGGGWKFFPIIAKKDTTIPMGIELEMQFKEARRSPRTVSWDMYKHQRTKDPKWNFFYCERDGSIGDFGLEMITQPMSQQMHNVFWDHMLPFIREHFSGWNTETRHTGGQYGIHITFDSQLYGQLNLARLIKFVENQKNQAFIQGIAQRGTIYQGDPRGIASSTKKISDVVYFDPKKGMQQSVNRNQPINLKTEKGLCEVRMFRSTLNTTSFFKNLEFLWAFHDWCKETSFNFLAENFLNWMLKAAATYYPKYPNLYKYMCHGQFPVKAPKTTVINSWSPYFNKVVLSLEKGQRDFFLDTVNFEPTEEIITPVSNETDGTTF